MNEPHGRLGLVKRSKSEWAIFVVSLVFLTFDALCTRRIYFTSLIGVLLINMSSPPRFMIADTRAWQKLTEWLVR